MCTSQKDIGEQGHASSYKVKQLHCHSIGRIKPVQLVVHHVGQISGCRWPQEQRRSAVSGVLLVVALVVLRIQCCSNRGAGHNAWTNVEAGSLLSECWSRRSCRRSLDTCLWRFLMRWRPPRTLTCQQLRLLSYRAAWSAVAHQGEFASWYDPYRLLFSQHSTRVGLQPSSGRHPRCTFPFLNGAI